jgi:hypothetical protein
MAYTSHMRHSFPLFFVSLSCLLIGCQEKQEPPSDLDKMVMTDEEPFEPSKDMLDKHIAQDNTLSPPELIFEEDESLK